MMASPTIRRFLYLRRFTGPVYQHAYFSSGSQSSAETMIKHPPNLIIDPKSKISPFHGMKRVVKSVLESDDDQHASEEEEEEEEEEEMKKKEEEYSEVYGVQAFLKEEEEEEEEEVWYDVMTKPQPDRVVPLPDRLLVNVLDKDDLTLSVGTIHLSEVVFGQDPVRVDILKRVVQYQRNKKRGKRYPALTKTVSEVSGSGKKIRPQKGMGMARVGHKRPAHFRGGAKAHGPKGVIQDYTTKLNKHVRKLGLVHALSQKLYENNLFVVNDWMLDTHRTKDLAERLSALRIGKKGSSAYILDWIDDESDDNVHRNMPLNMVVASGNLPRVKVAPQMTASVYDIIKHEKLILSIGAVQGLEGRLGRVTY